LVNICGGSGGKPGGGGSGLPPVGDSFLNEQVRVGMKVGFSDGISDYTGTVIGVAPKEYQTYADKAAGKAFIVNPEKARLSRSEKMQIEKLGGTLQYAADMTRIQ